MTLKKLSQLIINFRNQGTWKKFHNPKNLAVSLLLEASEVVEIFQWLNEKESLELKKDKQKLKGVAYEMADVLAYLFLLAESLGIDLEKKYKEKMKLNELRYPVEKAKGKALKYNKL